MQYMGMAYRYNRLLGAQITHKDVAEWGFIEALEIELAMEMLKDG